LNDLLQEKINKLKQEISNTEKELKIKKELVSELYLIMNEREKRKNSNNKNIMEKKKNHLGLKYRINLYKRNDKI